ncbi:MAG TPA: superoxide dismutase family protein [Gemmatimonadota bacterium]|nr:superoxide dismutase family protein [Gemmatimonadota bacterium]
MRLPLAASLAPFVVVACGLSIAFLACGEADEGDVAVGEADLPPAAEVTPVPDDATVDSARANMVDTRGVGIGAVILTAEGEDVVLRGALIALPPGEHGFHIHEKGSCEPPAFESAGDHIGAGETAHGFDAPDGPHAGDLRNITVAEDSTATVDQAAGSVTLRGGSAELLDDDGSAVVIHAGPDDYVTQPSGASGDRIACGVIEG